MCVIKKENYLIELVFFVDDKFQWNTVCLHFSAKTQRHLRRADWRRVVYIPYFKSVALPDSHRPTPTRTA